MASSRPIILNHLNLQQVCSAGNIQWNAGGQNGDVSGLNRVDLLSTVDSVEEKLIRAGLFPRKHRVDAPGQGELVKGFLHPVWRRQWPHAGGTSTRGGL